MAMHSSPSTDATAKREAMGKAGIWRWGCRCCGPKDRQEHTMIHQNERAIRKCEPRDQTEE